MILLKLLVGITGVRILVWICDTSLNWDGEVSEIIIASDLFS